MDETQAATSGANTDTSGSVQNEQQNANQSTSGDGQPDVSSTESQSNSNAHLAKMKKEKDNYVKKAQELQAKLDANEREAQEKRDAALVQKEEYKTLYEQEKEKTTKLGTELSQNKTQMADARKKSEVKSHLRKLGLNPVHEKAAFRLMDISKVVVDDETGVIVGAEDTAKAFHDEFKALGFFGKTGPGVSHNAPDNNSSGEGKLKALKTQKEFDAYMIQKYGN